MNARCHWRVECARAWKVAQGDAPTLRQVARLSTATRMAVFWVALSTLAGALGSLLFPIDYKGVHYAPTFFEAMMHAVTSFFIILGLLYLVHVLSQRLFQGSASFECFFRSAGYAYAIGILNFFPFLVVFVLPWILLILGKTLMAVHQLTREQAVSVLLLTLAIAGSVFFLALGLNPGNLYGGFYLAPY